MDDEIIDEPEVQESEAPSRRSALVKRTQKALDERKYDRADQPMSDKRQV